MIVFDTKIVLGMFVWAERPMVISESENNQLDLFCDVGDPKLYSK